MSFLFFFAQEIEKKVYERPFYPVEEDGDEEAPEASKFAWKNKLALIELLAYELADNGGKYESAFRSVRIADYAYYASKMPVKQKGKLKKEVMKRAADINHLREAVDVGDIVRVPKLKENKLLGGYIRDGRKLVEAEILSKETIASSFRYTVRRLDDGQIQKGNGHMIKGIISRVSEVSQ